MQEHKTSRASRSLNVAAAELRLEVTLTNGQAFGFRKLPGSNEYIGVLNRSVLRFREVNTSLLVELDCCFFRQTSADIEYLEEFPGNTDAKALGNSAEIIC